MCGLVSIFSSNSEFNLELLREMNNDIIHRGPDDSGLLIKDKFALGFRRLSIIDPSPKSNQPFYDETNNFVIVFNGEIYNYKILKKLLENENVKFSTNGDTEVFLKGYIHWGEKIFTLAEGMFSAIIVDQKKEKAIAIRDPLGIKPLYYTKYRNNIALSSEIKPLFRLVSRKVSESSIGELLTFSFNSGSDTGLHNIKKLKSGHLIRINYGSNIYIEEEYYNLASSFVVDEKITLEDAVDITESSLIKSIKQHLESDVGYSLQLSGGVDSSLICALASLETSKKLDSYSIRLTDEKYDEEKWRKGVIKKYNLNHHEIDVSFEDYADALPKAIKSMEAPIPHSGCIMLMKLYEKSKKNTKVMLTGEGADELFGGYHRYKDWKRLKQFSTIGPLIPKFSWKFLEKYEGIKRYSDRNGAIWSSVYQNYLELEKIFPNIKSDGSERLQQSNEVRDFRTKMLLVDQKVYLESLLFRQDKMSMASSIEARVPFAHLPLYKEINKIPNHIRISSHETKPLLKRVAEKYLDFNNVNRRKVGLTLPIDKMLKNPNSLGKYLNLFDGNSEISNYVDYKKIQKIAIDYRNGKYDHLASINMMPSLMNFINVELWLKSIK